MMSPLLPEDGPRVVAIGGGHGLARSLGAARRYASQIAAVVSVADDGGSSGRLREAFGIAAPGDIRRCLGALLPQTTPLGRALEYRFATGELEGHAFGNLLIASLVATTGDFVSGIHEACKVLGTVGDVYPATSCPVVLKAEADGSELEGQVKIMETENISKLSIVPPDAETPPPAIKAILAADQILIGPGSLFTSVLAALVPNDVATAVMASPARRIYIANLREQVPETAGYDVADHVDALAAHGVRPDVVVADTRHIKIGRLDPACELIESQIGAPNGLLHDEERLASVLREIVQR